MRQRRHASLVLGQTRSTEPLVLLIPWHGETDELIPRNRLVLETPLRCYEKYEPSWNKFKLPRRAHQQLLPVINRWIIKVPIILPFAADYFHSFAALQGSSRPRRLVGTKTSQNFAARGHKTTDLAICLQPPAEKKQKTKKNNGFFGLLLKLGLRWNYRFSSQWCGRSQHLVGWLVTEAEVSVAPTWHHKGPISTCTCTYSTSCLGELYGGEDRVGKHLVRAATLIAFINSEIDIAAVQIVASR